MAEIDPYAFSNAFNQQVQMGQQKRAYQNQQGQQQLENQRQSLRDMYMGEQQQWEREDRATAKQAGDATRRDQAAARVGELSRRALSLKDPTQMRGFLQQAIPTYAEDFSIIAGKPANAQEMLSVPDDQLAQVMQQLSAFGQQQGDQFEQVQGPRGTLLQKNSRTGELSQVVGQAPTPAASSQRRFRTLSPEEVRSAGLPDGTAAQQDEETGQINVLSKRDSTSALSQKDMTTARQKLNTVNLARQQLNAIRQRFGDLKGSMSAGAFGQGKLPTERGRAFDAAVDQMRSTLTALTRVPGVGAMSDYETRLDQAKFPSRENYESVTAQQIDAIDGMLNAIESGYTDLLGGQQDAPAAPSVDVEALLNKYAPRK